MKLDTNLIFDIGAHQGEDTIYYLLKGFRVVAVEANPELAALLHQKLAPAVQSGQLTIVDKILANSSFEKRPFYRNSAMSLWGTTHEAMVKRNETIWDGGVSEKIELDTISLVDLMNLFGAPYYLKVDIEGDDLMCVQQLSEVPPQERPHYISIESEKVNWQALLDEFKTFENLGYDAFQVVGQHKVDQQQIPMPPREGRILPDHFKLEKDATGLFGRDLPPQEWITLQQAVAKYRWIFLQYFLNGDHGILNSWKEGRARHEIRQFWDKILGFEVGWYDTHARRKDIT